MFGINFFVVIMAVLALIGLVAIGLIFKKLYKRAAKGLAYVRTGLGGEKVIKDGGSIVLPILHEITPVNLNTMRIQVRKERDEAILTNDNIRVDVQVDFFLKVNSTFESISLAAQSLGNKTIDPEALKALVESKFVDALRAVASKSTMAEMHVNRDKFASSVQSTITEDLHKNGLVLETCSLTGFDQTDIKYFKDDNSFDAQGRAAVAAIIATNRTKTNDIEQEAKISIERRNLEARNKSLEIEREGQTAQLDQERSLAQISNKQKSDIAKEEAASTQASREYQIAAEEAIAMREVERQRKLQSSETRSKRDIEIEKRDAAVSLAKKSAEEANAQAEALQSEANRVMEEEKVLTAKATEVAIRQKAISIIEAEENAEKNATSIRVESETRKEAAQNDAEALSIETKAKADAIITEAEARQKEYEVNAEGSALMLNAENSMSKEQVEYKRQIALLQALPGIVSAAVQPLTKIDGIKILQGYGANSVGGITSANSQGNGSAANSVAEAALQFRSHAPLVDELLREVGLVGSNGGLNDIVSGNSPAYDLPAKVSEADTHAPEETDQQECQTNLVEDSDTETDNQVQPV